MKKSVNNRLYLTQTLFILRMIEGTSIITHLNKFNSTVMDLININIKIEDEDQMLLLLLLYSLLSHLSILETQCFIKINYFIQRN